MGAAMSLGSDATDAGTGQQFSTSPATQQSKNKRLAAIAARKGVSLKTPAPSAPTVGAGVSALKTTLGE